jgi:hypothetical protein
MQHPLAAIIKDVYKERNIDDEYNINYENRNPRIDRSFSFGNGRYVYLDNYIKTEMWWNDRIQVIKDGKAFRDFMESIED